ncbi:hypothetical protein CMV30_11290 [Nibricoccus aquaticus]|uniref:Sel1 repeat family protein n=1 Tax=Nibricoccus aquaticus TaxID=2576891 RepID=A0A290QBB5_9BACT|nr:sel1 repeat family protein [Nibricoccus aquaticus]ATC64490.1 hypothetical protein CMV30_11290 [Nibricoccus aquaticus]
MRLPSPRRALYPRLILTAALLALPLFAQRYDSMSPRELQRRLERDTDQLIDSLRKQRNSPTRSGPPSGPSPWEQEIRSRREREASARAEQARLDAEWRRDHPNETRQQYFDRIDREQAAAAREERRQRDAAAAARRAQREREAAEIARREAANWARVRASHNGYAAEVSPPIFSSPTESLLWFLRHHNETQNEWAANQAAMLLMEGVGTPQNIPGALRLLDPNGPAAKKAGQRHPETRALFAYLQLTQPDAVKAAGFEVDVVAARQDLEAAASKTDLAKWYFARFLNNSDSPADQKLALRLITRGAFWARVYFAGFVNMSPAAHDPILKYVSPISLSIVEKQRAHIPTLIRELPMEEFENFDDLLPYVSEPLRTEAMTLYVEAIANRAVPLTPAQNFNYSAFDHILEKAGQAGIDGVAGLAALHRFHLLGIDELGAFRLSWDDEPDAARTLAALTRWSSRDDLLGARARLAIEGLALQAASPRRWTPPLLDEVALYQNAAREHARLVALAFVDADSPKTISQLRSEAEAAKNAAHVRALAARARRDANAPKPDAVPALLASIKASEQWADARNDLVLFAAGNPIFPSTFAVNDASFDLTKAAALYNEAFAAGTPTAVRRQRLLEAMRLGDAFAPVMIAAELPNASPSIEKLKQLSAARRARDVAAKIPRALTARLVEVRLRGEDFEPALTDAVAAGSVLAARLKTAQRIENSLSREADRPPSWNLSPALIAELDASLADWATPEFSAEWESLSHTLSSEDTSRAFAWFYPALQWEMDRQQRLLDDELIRAVQPQLDAVIATLSEWPGINQQDPRHTELLDRASRDRAAAEELVASDGLGALQLFIKAAGYGERSALEMLASHIRQGSGDLPRSAALADQLTAVAFKMTMADAEVGDSAAAEQIANSYRDGRGVAPDHAASLTWLRYAAELGELTAATALRDRALTAPVDKTAARHWSVFVEAIENLEHLPASPRRTPADSAPLAPVRAELETILAAADQNIAKAARITDAQRESFQSLNDDAYERLKENPASGLLALAKAAAAGSREAAFTAAQILATGRNGLEPDPTLARRVHALALKQLQIDAEYGDAFAAYHVGLYALDLPAAQPDPTAALRWLTYAAELGEPAAAEFLAKLYTDGAPGIAPDAKQSARWTAFAKKTLSDNFKPRAPLRR